MGNLGDRRSWKSVGDDTENRAVCCLVYTALESDGQERLSLSTQSSTRSYDKVYKFRLCVSLSVCPSPYFHTTHGPRCNLGNGKECPLVVQYWADSQSVHEFRCYDNIAPNAKCQRVLVLAECLVSLVVSFHCFLLFISSLFIRCNLLKNLDHVNCFSLILCGNLSLFHFIASNKFHICEANTETLIQQYWHFILLFVLLIRTKLWSFWLSSIFYATCTRMRLCKVFRDGWEQNIGKTCG